MALPFYVKIKKFYHFAPEIRLTKIVGKLVLES